MQWLLFSLIGAAVAYGIHRLSREARQMEEAASSFLDPKPDSPSISAQDMTQCSVCQAYVISGAGHCGREDCPFPRKDNS
ncbi:MAG TPA: hypothetical protein VHB73_07540 [Alphaproteobacteria bacterium]|nr:hypothetical protein [Alphaproteobacteria bacterium]